MGFGFNTNEVLIYTPTENSNDIFKVLFLFYKKKEKKINKNKSVFASFNRSTHVLKHQRGQFHGIQSHVVEHEKDNGTRSFLFSLVAADVPAGR